MTLYYVVPSPHPAAGWSYSIVGQEFDPQGSTIHSVLIPDISCDKILLQSWRNAARRDSCWWSSCAK